mmetsp:Transcript_24521/g.56049  ORF Transcript_24521/g.56049 Transcript_24521/m.56049 type:complete len:330 (+) Transcript_24521:390-1379(+)
MSKVFLPPICLQFFAYPYGKAIRLHQCVHIHLHGRRNDSISLFLRHFLRLFFENLVEHPPELSSRLLTLAPTQSFSHDVRPFSRIEIPTPRQSIRKLHQLHRHDRQHRIVHPHGKMFSYLEHPFHGGAPHHRVRVAVQKDVLARHAGFVAGRVERSQVRILHGAGGSAEVGIGHHSRHQRRSLGIGLDAVDGDGPARGGRGRRRPRVAHGGADGPHLRHHGVEQGDAVREILLLSSRRHRGGEEARGLGSVGIQERSEVFLRMQADRFQVRFRRGTAVQVQKEVVSGSLGSHYEEEPRPSVVVLVFPGIFSGLGNVIAVRKPIVRHRCV